MAYHVEYAEDRPLPQESMWALVVNDKPWVTLLCTPEKLDYLALGFLAGEGLISSLEDVATLEISDGVAGAGNAIMVGLRDGNRLLPSQRVVTSGCSGGVTFDLGEKLHPLNSHQVITPQQIYKLMQAMQRGTVEYRRTRGLHSAALANQESVLALAEDIGRHNALDKIWGECLAREIKTRNRLLLTSGRISSEMLRKAIKMRTPIVVSRTAPTDLSVQVARRLNVTIIGYVRGKRMRVYSGRQRVNASEVPTRVER